MESARNGSGRRGAFPASPELGFALLSVVLLLPALGQPFFRDDLNSIYEAAVSWKHPHHLLDPWMGGLVRIVPKLVMMTYLEVFGLRSWAYRAVNLLLHGLSVYLVARVFSRQSGSRSIGLWTEALFALGFGFYAAGVVQVSNITMVSALTLFLASVFFLQRGRRVLATTCFALAALCHEAVWVAPLLFFFWDPEHRRARGALLAGLLLLGVGCLLPGRPGTFARTETQYWVFALLPLNEQLIPAGGLPSWILHVAHVLVNMRPLLGYLALGLCLVIALRARGPGLTALGWLMILFLPFTAAIVFWPEVWPVNWLGRRYLYVPAPGLCLLAGAWLVGTRPRMRRTAMAAAVAWCLIWNALTLWGFARDAGSAQQRAARHDLKRELEALDPRWTR